jgi:hypothetical protein
MADPFGNAPLIEAQVPRSDGKGAHTTEPHDQTCACAWLALRPPFPTVRNADAARPPRPGATATSAGAGPRGLLYWSALRPRQAAGAWALLTALLVVAYRHVREHALRCSVNWSEYGAGPGCIEQTSTAPWIEISGKTYRDFSAFFADQDVLHLDLLIRPSEPGARFTVDTLREAAQLDLRLRGTPLVAPAGAPPLARELSYEQLCFRAPIRRTRDACPPTSVFGLAGVLPADVALVGDAGWTRYVGCVDQTTAQQQLQQQAPEAPSHEQGREPRGQPRGQPRAGAGGGGGGGVQLAGSAGRHVGAVRMLRFRYRCAATARAPRARAVARAR